MDDISIKDVWSSLVESHFDVSHRGVSSPETRARLSSLDTELVSMNRAIIVAKQRRNMLTGACHVPPEVLSTVFALAQKGWYPSTRLARNEDPDYNYGWINITHVCGYWREVAIQTASLWTRNINHVDLPLGLIPSICHRAKDLPLHFYLGLHLNNTDAELEDLEQFMPIWISSVSFSSRIQSLTIKCQEETVETVCTYLRQPMGSLLKLSVAVEAGVENLQYLPSDLCPDAGHLSELRLWDCLLPWDCHLLKTSLSHLELIIAQSAEVSIDFIPTYEKFREILSPMASLRSLRLENIFPDSLDTPIEQRIPINLLHANHISLVARQSWDSAMLLVPLLSFLPSTCVEIRLLSIGEYDTEMSLEDRVFELLPLLDPVVVAIFTGGGVTPAEIVVGLHDLSFHKAELPRDGWTTDFPRTAPQTPSRQIPPYGNSSAFLAVETSPEDADSAGELHLCRHFLSLPLRGVTAISFTRDAIADLVRVDRLHGLSTMSAIRRLGIEIQDSAPLLSLLFDQRVPGEAHTVFPLLEIIHVHAGGDKGLQEAICSSDTLALFNLVGTRRMSGAPLREIVIEQTLAEWDVWTAVSLNVPVSVYDFCDYGARESRRRKLNTS